MTNKELFIQCYNAHLDFEQATETLLNADVQMSDSMFSNAFYAIFDAVMSNILTEEGQNHLYEDILFQGYPLEEVLDSLSEYLKKI